MYKKEYFTASIDQSFGYLTLETIANAIFFQKMFDFCFSLQF